MFTDIRPGEGLTSVVLFANVFLILCAYYFIKPLREGWIVTSRIEGLTPMEVKAYSSFLQSLMLAGIASAFARLSFRFSRSALLTGSTLFCISNLVVFWFLYIGNVAYAGVAFFLWVGMFGVFVVAQFWTMAADLYAGERGARLLPVVAIGATAGAWMGSQLTGSLLDFGMKPSALLMLATIPLAVSILLSRLALARGPVGSGTADGPSRPAGAKPVQAAKHDGTGAIGFILRHRYLISVGLVVLFANWVNTNGENLLTRVVQETLTRNAASQGITDPAAVDAFLKQGTAQFYASFFTWVNFVALMSQAFLASRLLRYGGFGAIMLMLPTIALVSYSAMALVPILAVVRMLKIAENATDYSINNTARQVLWAPTTSEMRYRAKPAIDSLFVRLGDGLAALTVYFGVRHLELSTQAFFIVNVALVLTWLVLSIAIVRDYKQMMAAQPEPSPA